MSSFYTSLVTDFVLPCGRDNHIKIIFWQDMPGFHFPLKAQQPEHFVNNPLSQWQTYFPKNFTRPLKLL